MEFICNNDMFPRKGQMANKYQPNWGLNGHEYIYSQIFRSFECYNCRTKRYAQRNRL